MLPRCLFSNRALKLQNPSSLLASFFYAAANGSRSSPSPLPPPIRVSFTENAGRGTFATRNINAGDLIHTAKPLVAHPSLSFLHKVCYFCLKQLRMSASASSCNQQITSFSESTASVDSIIFDLSKLYSNVNHGISFCSEECKERSQAFYEVEKGVDWSAYDDHCRLQGLKYPFLAKRLACMVISGAAPADSLSILQPASFSPDMILKMEEEFELLRCSFMKAGIKDEQLAFLTKQWYVGVMARIRINAFRVELAGGIFDSEDLFSSAMASVSAEASMGNAVYMLPSFYNHDCDPNAHIIWIENTDARLKALCNIEAGEELRICYIDASMDREARQALLYQGYGFRCHCLRCLHGD